MAKPVLDSDYFRKPTWLIEPFSKRYRARRGQKQLDPVVRTVIEHLVVSGDEKLVYIKNSKAGCTSVTRLLHLYSKGEEFAASDGLHLFHDGFRQGICHWKENYALMRSGKAFVFSSIRHPQTRVVSAFTNFFVDMKNKSTPKHLPAMRRFGFSESNSTAQNFDVFLDYIEASFAANEVLTDWHWRKQVHNLAWGQIEYDYLARLENLNRDLAEIKKLAGLDDPHDAFHRPARSNQSSAAKFQPDAAQAARIFTLYRDDFEALGYMPVDIGQTGSAGTGTRP